MKTRIALIGHIGRKFTCSTTWALSITLAVISLARAEVNEENSVSCLTRAASNNSTNIGNLKSKLRNTVVTDIVNPYDDVRGSATWTTKDISNADLSKKAALLTTLTFNEKTMWPDKSKMPPGPTPAEILQNAKNPGLSIKDLHRKGIFGKGVNVAIIDQPLYQDHPEFTGKIVEYKDFGTKAESSMHGPAVASLLVGNNIGTAPGAKLYYAAVPSWLADAEYYAKALDWIIEVNSTLSAKDKIRVVSVSAAPSGKGSPFKSNNDKWTSRMEKAMAEGILVLDCSSNYGFIAPGYYDTNDVDNVSKCVSGFPQKTGRGSIPDRIVVPCSFRTVAEEYEKGDFAYQYTGQGGLSWSIPYCAGVMAMGWQERPELTADEMKRLLFDSAYKSACGSLIVNPPEFIKAVIAHKKAR